MFRLSRLLVLLTIVLSTVPISPAADTWLSVRSRNFLLVGNAGESQIRKVGRNLEEFRAAMATLFPGIGENSSVGTTVVVFKNDDSFRPFKPLYDGKPANIGGIFIGGPDLNSIALTADIRSTQVIYHEFVHSLTRESGTPLPLWVGEGIAELYSTFEIASNLKQLTLGRPVTSHIATLRENAFLPLPIFFGVERDSPYYNEKSKQGIFYAQSWATLHYLLLADNGRRRPQFSDYLRLLSAGKSRDESFREAFQMDYGALEKALNDYARARFSLPGLTFDLNQKLDFDWEMQVAPLGEAAMTYYLGDLLLHMDRLDAAEAQLQKSLSLESKAAPSHASMGLLRLRQDREEEALEHLSNAVEADSQNHMVHYYYATMLQKPRQDQSKEDRESRLKLMRDHLKKCIELAPRYVEAYNLLAYVASLLQEEMDETEQAVKKAIGFAPGRQDLQLSLIQLMAFNNKAQAARVLLTRLVNAAADDDIRDRAEEMLKSVTARLQYENELRAYEERRQAAREEVRGVEPRIESSTGEPPELTRKSTPPARAEEPPARIVLNRPQGSEIEGLLTRIDCRGGVTFRLRMGNGFVELHSEDPDKVEFRSYVSSITGSIPCGAVNPEVPVRIVYRRTSAGNVLGEPLLVEFIEK